MTDHKTEPFIKGHGPTIAEDWDNANRLFRLSLMIPGLEAPEPLTLDTARKTISYQRMLGLIPFIGRCNDKGLAAKTGALIAQLHLTETTSSTEDERSAAAWLRSIGTSDRDIETIRSHVSPGFLHKDCWHGNLFWNHRGGLVVTADVKLTP